VRLALGHRSVRGLILLLVGLLTLWSVAGLLLSRQLASRQSTTVGAALASVQAIVATAFEDVRREAWLLSQDPAVVEGTNRSDWATLARGAGPRMQALTRERFADLLLDEVAATLEGAPADALEDELRGLDLLRYCRGALAKRGSA